MEGNNKWLPKIKKHVADKGGEVIPYSAEFEGFLVMESPDDVNKQAELAKEYGGT